VGDHFLLKECSKIFTEYLFHQVSSNERVCNVKFKKQKNSMQKLTGLIFEHRIWQQIDIDDMQFGFVKGKGTTDAIFIVRQIYLFIRYSTKQYDKQCKIETLKYTERRQGV